MAIKKGDFAEITYTGKMKEEDIVFDTTQEDTAKKEGIYNKNAPYGPVIVCVGERQVIQGLDDALVGKGKGTYEILIAPEDGFGKKNSKLLRLMPLSAFTKQNLQVQPGLQVNVDGSMGIVRTVTGGRVIVDFNHPLSGKDLSYTFSILRVVDKTEEKTAGLIRMMGLSQLENKITATSVTLTFPSMVPRDIQEEIQSKIKSLIPEITAVTFEMARPAAPKKGDSKKGTADDDSEATKPALPADESAKKVDF